MNFSVSAEGEQIATGALHGFVVGKPVVLNIKVGIASHRCAIYNGGWELSHFVAMLDGDAYKLTRHEARLVFKSGASNYGWRTNRA